MQGDCCRFLSMVNETNGVLPLAIAETEQLITSLDTGQIAGLV